MQSALAAYDALVGPDLPFTLNFNDSNQVEKFVRNYGPLISGALGVPKVQNHCIRAAEMQLAAYRCCLEVASVTSLPVTYGILCPSPADADLVRNILRPGPGSIIRYFFPKQRYGSDAVRENRWRMRAKVSAALFKRREVVYAGMHGDYGHQHEVYFVDQNLEHPKLLDGTNEYLFGFNCFYYYLSETLARIACTGTIVTGTRDMPNHIMIAAAAIQKRIPFVEGYPFVVSDRELGFYFRIAPNGHAKTCSCKNQTNDYHLYDIYYTPDDHGYANGDGYTQNFSIFMATQISGFRGDNAHPAVDVRTASLPLGGMIVTYQQGCPNVKTIDTGYLALPDVTHRISKPHYVVARAAQIQRLTATVVNTDEGVLVSNLKVRQAVMRMDVQPTCDSIARDANTTYAIAAHVHESVTRAKGRGQRYRLIGRPGYLMHKYDCFKKKLAEKGVFPRLIDTNARAATRYHMNEEKPWREGFGPIKLILELPLQEFSFDLLGFLQNATGPKAALPTRIFEQDGACTEMLQLIDPELSADVAALRKQCKDKNIKVLEENDGSPGKAVIINDGHVAVRLTSANQRPETIYFDGLTRDTKPARTNYEQLLYELRECYEAVARACGRGGD